jgi:hypothetical protein
MNKIAILSSFVFSFASAYGAFSFAYAELPTTEISLQHIDQETVSKFHPETTIRCNAGWGNCATHEAKPQANTV